MSNAVRSWFRVCSRRLMPLLLHHALSFLLHMSSITPAVYVLDPAPSCAPAPAPNPRSPRPSCGQTPDPCYNTNHLRRRRRRRGEAWAACACPTTTAPPSRGAPTWRRRRGTSRLVPPGDDSVAPLIPLDRPASNPARADRVVRPVRLARHPRRGCTRRLARATS